MAIMALFVIELFSAHSFFYLSTYSISKKINPEVQLKLYPHEVFKHVGLAMKKHAHCSQPLNLFSGSKLSFKETSFLN